MMNYWSVLFSAILFGIPSPALAQNTGPPIAFRNVTVIDCTGAAPKPDMTMIVKRDRITALGESAEVVVPEDALIIDATGKYVIPGLWDMHVHVRSYETPLFVANGVTGVRIMYGRQRDIEARERVQDRVTFIPDRNVACAPFVDGSYEIWRDRDLIQVTTEEEARQAVRTVKQRGFDSVKISSNLNPKLFKAVANESTRPGIPFAGHVPDSVSVESASESGQRSIEHLTGVSIGCSRFAIELHEQFSQTKGGGQVRGDIMKRARESYDKKKAQRLFAKFVRNGTWQCPTLTLFQARARAADPELFQDNRLQYMPNWESNRWNRDLKAMAKFAKRPSDKFRHQLRIVGDMHEAGVRILAGTDTANPYCFQGFGIHDELELLVRSGLSPSAALLTATRNPAEYMGRINELGTIEKGKIADLVLLDENPLEDITNTRKIAGVVMRGCWYPKSKLQLMLNQARLTAKIENTTGRLKRDVTKAHQPVVEVVLVKKEITDKEVSQLREFKELETLGLSKSQISDEMLAFVSEFPRLQRLDLRDTTVSDTGLAHLGNLKNLQQLWLGSTNITDDGLTAIMSLSTLQELALTNTPIGDKGIDHLKSLSGLTELWLSGTKVSDLGLQNLRGLSQLRVLALRDTRVSDVGLENISGLVHLEHLVLTSNQVSDIGLRHLSKLKNLTTLRLGHTQVTDAGIKHLKGLSNLRELTLNGTRVTETGIKELKQTIPDLIVKHSPYGYLTVAVSRSADDAEELSNGIMHINSLDLELVRDEGRRIIGTGDQVIGLRFDNIDIPRDSRLTGAYVQFTAREANADEADLTIQAELTRNPESFESDQGNITGRLLTPKSVRWSPPPWKSVGDHGESQQTSDITSLLNAVMAQAEWKRGNSLVLIFKGKGRRVAETYDGNPGNAATLHIKYE